MNGPDHYREAERLLDLSARRELEGHDDHTEATIQLAAVHALLAVAASNTATDRAHFTAWREVTQ